MKRYYICYRKDLSVDTDHYYVNAENEDEAKKKFWGQHPYKAVLAINEFHDGEYYD